MGGWVVAVEGEKTEVSMACGFEDTIQGNPVERGAALQAFPPKTWAREPTAGKGRVRTELKEQLVAT